MILKTAPFVFCALACMKCKLKNSLTDSHVTTYAYYMLHFEKDCIALTT